MSADPRDYPYYWTRSDGIVVNDGWRRDCRCRMNPCDVPWHYARTTPKRHIETPSPPKDGCGVASCEAVCGNCREVKP
jgi:hypothetical protein